MEEADKQLDYKKAASSAGRMIAARSKLNEISPFLIGKGAQTNAAYGIYTKGLMDKYEKLAEPYYAEINEAAAQLAEERRYDDALRKIDAFPQHLRLCRSWINLDKLRQDVERRKKDAAPKKK